MFRHADGGDFAVRDVQINGELVHALDGVGITGHGRAGFFAPRGSGLPERVVDRVAGQRHAGLHVNLRVLNVLSDKRAQHCFVRDEIRAQARRFIVFRHADAHDLALAVQFDGDLEGLETGHVVNRCACGGRFRLGRLSGFPFCFRAAVGRRGSREDRVLVARLGLDAQRTLRVRKDLLAGVQESAGRHGRAGNLVDVRAQRVGIRRDADELLLESVLADAAAQTRSLLQGADVNLRHVAFGADAHRNRDLSAVALRGSGQRIALDFAGGILADEDFVELAAFGKILKFNLFVLAPGQDRAECGFLGRQLLLRDRALRHFVGYRQRRRGDEGKQEQANAQFQNIIHAC